MGLLDLTSTSFSSATGLVGSVVPAMLETDVKAMGGIGQVQAQIINGAPIIYNWEHSADAEGVDARRALPTGKYEVVVISEALPLLNHLRWSEPPFMCANSMTCLSPTSRTCASISKTLGTS